MTNVFLRWIVFGLVLAGCSDTASESEPPEPVTVTFSACVQDINTGNMMSDVVCSVMDHSEIPTAVTDSDGCFELRGLPPNEQLALTWAKEGYWQRIRTVRTGATDFHYGTEMMSQVGTAEQQQAFADAIGVSIDVTRPTLNLLATPSDASFDEAASFSNIEVSLDDASVPICKFTSVFPHCELGGCCGTAEDNVGFVQAWNLDEGTLEFTVGPADVDCGATLGGTDWQLAWPAGRDNAFLFPAVENIETWVTVGCRR